MEKRHPYAKAGFIHLPLENDYPTPRVVDALERAINVVVRDGTLRGMALSIAGLSWFGLGLYLGPQCDPLRDKALRLLKRLRTAGPASMTDLLKNHHFSKRERESLLARFVAEGLVRVEGKEVVSTTYREFVKRLHASAEFPPVVNHWEELQAQFVGAAKQGT